MAVSAEDIRILKEVEVGSNVLASVIVPAYNEEAGIGFVLDSVFQAVDSRCEVLVVDDGSADATSLIASRFPCRIVRHVQNRGKGEAMMTGLRHAEGDYVIFIDADGTYPADFIPQMIDLLATSDVVYCSRSSGRDNIPFLNRIGNQVFHNSIRYAYGFQGRDYATGLYGIRKSHLEGMDIVSSGFAIEPEIAIKASRMKLRIHDIPIEYQPRKGKPKLGSFKAGWEHTKTIVGLLNWQPPQEEAPMEQAWWMKDATTGRFNKIK